MNILKGIVYWIAYFVMGIAKIPFTLLSALAQGVELIYLWALAQITKWYNNDTANEIVDAVFNANAGGYEYIGDTILDMLD